MNTTQRATPATASPSGNTTSNPSTAPAHQKAQPYPNHAMQSAGSADTCSSTAGAGQTQNETLSPPVNSMQQSQINQLKETLNKTAPMIQQLHRQGLISTATYNDIKDEFELSRITLGMRS